MWGRAAIYVVSGAILVVVWYIFLLRSNRRQGRQVLEWIQAAIAGKGQAFALRWLGASVFHVALRLDTSFFQHPALIVRLVPREMPLHWLKHWWRREFATITFEADLEISPRFDLQVQQHRWSGRSSKNVSPDPDSWYFEQLTPLIMTSRPCWQPDVATMMNALLSCRHREVVDLSFRRKSPHFSATIALDCISPEGRGGSNLLDTLRELAAGASASRM